MKKLLVLTMLLFFLRAEAQKINEGVIRYKLTLETVSSRTGKPAGFTTDNITYLKNGKALYESTNPYLKTRVLIDDKGVLMLMDGTSGRYKKFYRKPKPLLDAARLKSLAQNIKVVNTKEKKMMLGYECFKTLITYIDAKAVKNEFTIWRAEKIPNFPLNNEGGILNPGIMTRLKGMPLEIDMINGKSTAKMLVTSVSTKPVPDAVFAVSTAGYTEMIPKNAKKPAR